MVFPLFSIDTNSVPSGISSVINNEFTVSSLLLVTLIVYIISSSALTVLYPVDVTDVFVAVILLSLTFTFSVETFNASGVHLTE